jgi:hypothetical protein
MTAGRLEFVARVDAQGPFRANLEMGTDEVEVTTATGVHTPDLAWEFVDEAGHFHAWTKDGQLPTVDRHVERIPCGHMHGDLEELEECGGSERVTIVCKLCGEDVEPKYNVDHSRQFIPGRSYWSADIYGVHLHPGDKVSVVFANGHTGRALWFGIAEVGPISIEDSTYVTRLNGAGPLGRKGGVTK